MAWSCYAAVWSECCVCCSASHIRHARTVRHETCAGKPTRVQVRHPSGRTILQLKATSLVVELYHHVACLLKLTHTVVSTHPDAKDEFDIVRPHPAESLREDASKGSTLESASLLNAAVIVRITA